MDSWEGKSYRSLAYGASYWAFISIDFSDIEHHAGSVYVATEKLSAALTATSFGEVSAFLFRQNLILAHPDPLQLVKAAENLHVNLFTAIESKIQHISLGIALSAHPFKSFPTDYNIWLMSLMARAVRKSATQPFEICRFDPLSLVQDVLMIDTLPELLGATPPAGTVTSMLIDKYHCLPYRPLSVLKSYAPTAPYFLMIDLVGYNRMAEVEDLTTVGYGVSDRMKIGWNALLSGSHLGLDSSLYAAFRLRVEMQNHLLRELRLVGQGLLAASFALVGAAPDGSFGNDGLLALSKSDEEIDYHAEKATKILESAGLKSVAVVGSLAHGLPAPLILAERCLAATKIVSVSNIDTNIMRIPCKACHSIPFRSDSDYVQKQLAKINSCSYLMLDDN